MIRPLFQRRGRCDSDRILSWSGLGQASFLFNFFHSILLGFLVDLQMENACWEVALIENSYSNEQADSDGVHFSDRW